MFIVLIGFIGLRHNIGMDWNNYLIIFHRVTEQIGLTALLGRTEPGYVLILELGALSGLGIYGANLITAGIIVSGLFYWARKSAEPWLALVSAFPMFIVVFSMSANRQALAAAAIMVVIGLWYRLSLVGRIAAILACASFHYSALIFLVFVALDLKVRWEIRAVLTIGCLALMFGILLQTGQSEYYVDAYGNQTSEAFRSEGALYHLALNAILASLYFFLPRARSILFPNRLLRNLAFACLLTVPLALAFSTLASRMNFYWFPMSMFVAGALPQIVDFKMRPLLRIGICLVYGLTMIVWLTYANSAQAYIPYKNLIFMDARMSVLR
ncbi:hypothetical protein GRI43_11195 [Altererythrobacter luteolus]|uniref:EpsG family protein n=2 Tax=Pontixanthobacter luteolus TaxID=295089 RepID=A0A6I4V512_9SPHN|nr:hypothetical protein [Pontixanthobacter luteolus]